MERRLFGQTTKVNSVRCTVKKKSFESRFKNRNRLTIDCTLTGKVNVQFIRGYIMVWFWEPSAYVTCRLWEYTRLFQCIRITTSKGLRWPRNPSKCEVRTGLYRWHYSYTKRSNGRQGAVPKTTPISSTLKWLAPHHERKEVRYMIHTGVDQWIIWRAMIDPSSTHPTCYYSSLK
jgi:hypothetical protein